MFKRFWQDEAGSSSVEYAVLATVSITLGSIAASNLGPGASQAAVNIETSINTDRGEVPVRVVYDADNFDLMRAELRDFELHDLEVMTQFSELITLAAAMEPDALDQQLMNDLSDLNIALDLTWQERGEDRPDDVSVTEQDILDLMARMGREDLAAELEAAFEEADDEINTGFDG